MIKLRVYHAGYGCDTGCCGHIFEFDGKQKIDFEFGHPYIGHPDADYKAFAQRIIKERAPECYDSIDWDTVDVSEVSED